MSAAIAESYSAEEPDLSPQAQHNIAIGRQKKDAGDQAFKAGDVKAALLAYHQALMYFRGINKQNPMGAATPQAEGQEKPKGVVDEDLAKVYSNMSACHLKLENWQRTVETADKAIALNKDNFKALFRKGKALGEQGYYERAVTILEDLRSRNPADAPTINAELASLKAKEKVREKKHNQKFKGFLSRDKSVLSSTDDSTDDATASSEPPASAHIEEVTEVAAEAN